MNQIAIESSSELCSVALTNGTEILQRISNEPRQHAEQILPMIDQLLADAGLQKNSLDQVVVGRGPGSFTGVRIACSVAQGLGHGLNIPVLPISSLAGLAQATTRVETTLAAGAQIIAAIDARLAEIYLGLYQLDTQRIPQLIGEESVTPPGDAASCLIGIDRDDRASRVGAGSGWQAYTEALQEQIHPPVANILADCRADAQALLELAAHYPYNTHAVSAEQALPIYLRDQVTHRGQDSQQS